MVLILPRVAPDAPLSVRSAAVDRARYGARVRCASCQAAAVLSEGDVSQFVEELLGAAVRSCRRLEGGLEADVFAAATTSERYAVKISPAWRSEEELDWVRSVAGFSHRRVPEAVAPLGHGRLLGRPATVYPLIDGEALPAADRGACLDAARGLTGVARRSLPAGCR